MEKLGLCEDDATNKPGKGKSTRKKSKTRIKVRERVDHDGNIIIS